MKSTQNRLLLLFFAALWLAGCTALVAPVPTIPPLPTLTASPQATSVPPTQPPTEDPTPPVIAVQAATATAVEGAAPLSPSTQPEIGYFSAAPGQVNPGEPATLFWSSSGGATTLVQRLAFNGTVDQSWRVDASGSLEVTPTRAGRSERYVLLVQNGEQSIEAALDVFVFCTSEWFFEPAPAQGCPDGTPVVTGGVSQQFQRGVMIRLDITGEIIVLFDVDYGSLNDVQQAWIITPDTFGPGDPVDDPLLEVPSGYQQPRDNFGKVWREVAGVRDRLGWATESEVGYSATLQRETLDSQFSLYFSNRDGEVIQLVPGGQGWLVVGYLP